ncbi:MAG: gfo/Idh/MocA family oxidoreductase, partial [Candidatus Omnitrophica bacterium]|nr:gfo/Idh/MocA family oxidoreductase [Candidatus Omnitrophota bacterium]
IRLFQKDCYISLDYGAQEAVVSKRIKNKIVSRKIDIKKEQPLQKEISSFVHCVLHKKRPLVSGIEACNALSVAHTIIKKIKL